jgi:hypothetical protein
MELELVEQARVRDCATVSAPPATCTSFSPAAALACAGALSSPSVTNVNVAPPWRSQGSRGSWVRTSTGATAVGRASRRLPRRTSGVPSRTRLLGRSSLRPARHRGILPARATAPCARRTRLKLRLSVDPTMSVKRTVASVRARTAAGGRPVACRRPGVTVREPHPPLVARNHRREPTDPIPEPLRQQRQADLEVVHEAGYEQQVNGDLSAHGVGDRNVAILRERMGARLTRRPAYLASVVL